MLTGSKIRDRSRLLVELASTKSSRTSYLEALPFRLNLSTTAHGLRRSGNMRSIRKEKSAYVGTGIRPPGERLIPGSDRCSTSLLSDEKKRDQIRRMSAQVRQQKKLSSTTGKLVKSIPTTMTKSPFTASLSSPNTLLCVKCERSTFTLILDKSGRKPFLQVRCTNCGQRGMIEPANSSKLLKVPKK